MWPYLRKTSAWDILWKSSLHHKHYLRTNLSLSLRPNARLVLDIERLMCARARTIEIEKLRVAKYADSVSVYCEHILSQDPEYGYEPSSW